MNKLVIKGLTEQEAQERLNSEGYNELPSSKKRSIFFIAFEVAKEPMFILLVSCGIIYLILGDVREAIILMFFVFVIMCITFIQERKTERALESLRDLTSPRASVLRDGQKIRIAGREVVRGDIMILAEGDRIPADAILLESQNLSIDESLLTGESVPVMKYPDELDNTVMSGGENQSYLFSGTMVVQGQGIAEVVSVGTNTKIGKIGKSLQVIKEEETILKKDIRKTVKVIGITSAILCIVVVVVYGITRANWLNGFLAGITLAMAMIPEEFPVVLTIFMSLGAWRISQKRVLTRRIPAVETLGSVTVICSDKTGTLTKGEMTIRKIFTQNNILEVSGTGYEPSGQFNGLDKIDNNSFQLLLKSGILCNDSELYEKDKKWSIKGDSTEGALLVVAAKNNVNVNEVKTKNQRIHEFPFSSERKRMTTIHQMENGKKLAFIKGAPEVVLKRCSQFLYRDKTINIDENEMQLILKTNEDMAKDALRIIALCYKEITEGTKYEEDVIENNMVFLGLVGMMDPPREEAIEATKICKEVHIKPVMITGDHKLTAVAVAKEIGFYKDGDMVLTGEELERYSDEEFARIVDKVSVYARVSPMDKLKIVNAWKKRGDIVAMTGDGVNDAPALKHADIGIAMGITGTEVTKEAADMVLSDDNFATIVKAIGLGRWIYDNIKKFMKDRILLEHCTAQKVTYRDSFPTHFSSPHYPLSHSRF